MKKSFILPLIILMTISLAGIVLIQMFWIKNAIEVKEERFDQNVNEALSEVIERLKVDEDVFYVANQIWTDEDGQELKYIAYSTDYGIMNLSWMGPIQIRMFMLVMMNHEQYN